MGKSERETFARVPSEDRGPSTVDREPIDYSARGYFFAVPSASGLSPDERARVAYAGGDVRFEEVEEEYAKHGWLFYRKLGRPIESARSGMGGGAATPFFSLKQRLLPPADY